MKSSRSYVAGMWFLLIGAAAAAPAMAQSSSLYGQPGQRRELTLPQDSWTYQRPLEQQPVQLNDIVTVVVNEQSVVISEGQMDRKKKASADWNLKNWVFLRGFSAVPSTPATQPRVTGEMDSKYRADATLETRDSMKFRMACHVVDIRPNGNLVIEGRRSIQNNEETWEYALTGEIRAKDIMPNNTILSENVADIRLNKREVGHVRDGYRRGWFLKSFDKYQPF